MAPLTAGRNTPRADGDVQSYPVLASTKIHAGALTALDASGWGVPGATATTLVAVGRADEAVDNSAGANGALNVKVRFGTFRYENSAAGDLITAAEIGDDCYMVDDQTVAKTSGSSTRSIAGKIAQVDAQGVWVAMGMTVKNAPAGVLSAASNLSDLGTVATARSNLGVFEKLGAPTIVVGTEASNVINVTIQLNDSAAAALAVRGSLPAYLSDDANGDSIAATAPDGGVAVGTDGVLIPLIANKAFTLVSEADGDIDIDITESGVDTFYLILIMPDGKLVASGAITFA